MHVSRALGLFMDALCVKDGICKVNATVHRVNTVVYAGRTVVYTGLHSVRRVNTDARRVYAG